MYIKNSRSERRGKSHHGPWRKDPWTKTTGVRRIEGWRWGWVGQGKVMGGNEDNCN